MAQPDALLAQLGAPGPEAPPEEETLPLEESGDAMGEEEVSMLMDDFDDTTLPASERVAALRAALGL